MAGAYVIFEPGARSFWHTHPTGQVLIIAEGEGRSGVYGQKVSVLKKGDVMSAPRASSTSTVPLRISAWFR